MKNREDALSIAGVRFWSGEASVGIFGVYWITTGGARSFTHDPGVQADSSQWLRC